MSEAEERLSGTIRTTMPARETEHDALFALRSLPSVDALLKQPAVAMLLDEFPREELLRAVREALDERRAALLHGRRVSTDTPGLALDIRQRLYERARPSLRRVINATGIVLHTGLGRAPLASEAVQAVAEVAGGYSNLELDLASGERGDRHEHTRALLRELTGAADALVVNNNAAATMLALRALAEGREAIVARGQLVEIGGSYRMPDIMAASGCRMVEVGTTNRTRIGDYEQALTDQTAVLLHVHTSNYRIRGFTESASIAELAALARRRRPQGLHVLDDLGSGLLFDAPGAEWDEPGVRESVRDGADLVFFSGDKLLGGPQAGVIIGRSDLVDRLRRNALARAVRPDKMTLAALEATLRLYRDPQTLRERLPTARMLLARPETLRSTAESLARALSGLARADVEPRADSSFAGGGSLPTLELPTWTVTLRVRDVPAERLAAALRLGEVPVICRVQRESLVLDCRTIQPDDIEQIAASLTAALMQQPERGA